MANIKLKENTSLSTNVNQLSNMITQAIDYQVTVMPIFKSIADSILGILSQENELNNLEPKDLIKLLEVASKAQIAPVEQLTKLVQAVTALQNQSELQSKIDALEKVVDIIKTETKAPVYDAKPYDEPPTLEGILEELDD
jgi:hypothetical protein